MEPSAVLSGARDPGAACVCRSRRALVIGLIVNTSANGMRFPGGFHGMFFARCDVEATLRVEWIESRAVEGAKRWCVLTAVVRLEV